MNKMARGDAKIQLKNIPEQGDRFIRNDAP